MIYDNYGTLVHTSRTSTFWTPPKKISSIKVRGNKASWKKVKGAKGYMVVYKKTEYRGMNAFLEKVYYVKYAVGTTRSTSFGVPSGWKITKVIPYSSHSKRVYAPYVGATKKEIMGYEGIYKSEKQLKKVIAYTENYLHDTVIYK